MPQSIQAASEGSQQLLRFLFFPLGVIVAEVVTFMGQGKSLLKLKAVLLIPGPGSA